MTDYRDLDPYDLFKKFNDQLEKQMNEFIHLYTDNQAFLHFTKNSTDAQVRYYEIFKKNQDILANQLNLPTKSDLTNVIKISLQTEEKLDSLEEQIWHLQDTISNSNLEIESIVDVTRDIIKLSKQLKSELTKTKKEISEIKNVQSQIEEVKSELAGLQNLKKELAELKEILKDSNTHEYPEEYERELVGTTTK